MQIKNLRFIDLFSGVGGFHQALSYFGAHCVFASEWNTHAAYTYEVNYGIKPHGDLTQIHEKEIPQHDILCGGFPCQAFSISGKQKGFEDTRGTLFFDIARIIAHHKPRLIFLENVRNLIRHDQGKTIRIIQSTLENLGYNVYYKVLNASHFKLPQNRARVYFVCLEKGRTPDGFEFPPPSPTPTSLSDFLEDHPHHAKVIERTDIQINKRYTPPQDQNGQIKLPNKPIQIGIVNKGGQGERIYDPWGHAITLSAHGGGVGSKTGLYKVGSVIRKLSPRECARIQGFPEDFKIVSSPAQAYKQFGNSVAINVLKAILNQVSLLQTTELSR
jgi:DNA (cytosine-5)-methyltransferase 1